MGSVPQKNPLCGDRAVGPNRDRRDGGRMAEGDSRKKEVNPRETGNALNLEERDKRGHLQLKPSFLQ